MERPLLRVLLVRAVLFALPFAVWFVWREIARRTGRDVGSTPWAWLFAAGAVLAALSLMATVVFQRDNRSETYVPADTTADGEVVSGHYEKSEAP
jgi:membrane protein YdbS with pleckstrin-like domain